MRKTTKQNVKSVDTRWNICQRLYMIQQESIKPCTVTVVSVHRSSYVQRKSGFARMIISQWSWVFRICIKQGFVFFNSADINLSTDAWIGKFPTLVQPLANKCPTSWTGNLSDVPQMPGAWWSSELTVPKCPCGLRVKQGGHRLKKEDQKRKLVLTWLVYNVSAKFHCSRCCVSKVCAYDSKISCSFSEKP